MLKRKPKTRAQMMREQADEVMERLAPHMESARDKAAPLIADARERTAPYVAEVREKASPVVEGAKTKFTAEVLPVLTAAVAAAAEATEDVREEAMKRGAATAAALKGEVAPPKETHKLRNFLILIGLGGVAALVAKKLSDREAKTAWQSSYTPTPSSTATTTDTMSTTPSYSAPGVAAVGTADTEDTPLGTAAAAAAAQPRDEAGAGPDEAAADATDLPHPSTTPDDPRDEIRLDGDKS